MNPGSLKTLAVSTCYKMAGYLLGKEESPLPEYSQREIELNALACELFITADCLNREENPAAQNTAALLFESNLERLLEAYKGDIQEIHDHPVLYEVVTLLKGVDDIGDLKSVAQALKPYSHDDVIKAIQTGGKLGNHSLTLPDEPERSRNNPFNDGRGVPMWIGM